MPVPAAPLSRHAMAYVLAGGRGTRLFELTDKRVKPAVYFGCKTRIIDFALSNALNSGIRHIAVATQYKAHSLIRHMQAGWNFLRPERNESFDILPAQRISESMWYEGTADAVYQNIDIVESYGVEYVVVLAGDHIYKMDYEVMLRQHVDEGADVTVGCIEVPRAEASGFGVMAIDDNDRIISFLEKPKDPPGMPDRPEMALASMGIYVFSTRVLVDQLRRDASEEGSSRDFGKDLIPYLVTNGKAVAHRFTNSCVRSSGEAEAYWRDVGTLDAYWAANIDLTQSTPPHGPVRRGVADLDQCRITPPAKVINNGQRSEVTDSLLSGGCMVTGAAVQRSLLFTRTQVHPGASLEEAVVLPSVEIGRGARLKKVVIDRGVRIPAGLAVGENPDVDAQRFRRSAAGVCLITQSMLDRIEA